MSDIAIPSSGRHIVPTSPMPLTVSSRKIVNRMLERLNPQLLEIEIRERERAALVSEASFEVASLTMLQDTLVNIAPRSEARYESLLDAYVAGAVSAIRKL